jgi:hypothetical protein
MAAGKTYEPIATNTLGSAASSVTFSSIPGTYTDLVLVMNLFVGASNPDTAIRFNSDTGTNYSRTRIAGNGASPNSSRSSNEDAGYLIPQTLDNNTSAAIVANINNYSNTTTYKTLLERYNGAQLTNFGAVGSTAILWRSTAAISTILITSLGTGNYSAGSTFTLYGIAAA